jgi:membrane-associated phospholipid phosphatase
MEDYAMTKAEQLHSNEDKRDQAHSPAKSTVHKPQTRGEYVAYGISQLGSPPIMSLVALVFVVVSLTWSAAWLWTSVYMMAMLAPLIFLIWQLRQGRVTDIDITVREQRQGSQLVTIVSCAVAWFSMWLGGAPPILTLMAGVGFVQWIIIYTITLRWKISVHTASAAGATLIILRVVGIAAAPLVISLPLIAWSRVKLRRHTPAQTIAGALLGSGVVVGALLLSPAI